jgi:hypothetical protein
MTPQLASRLKVHERNIGGTTAAGEGVLTAPWVAPPLAPPRDARPDLDDACLPALWRREAVHRRLLGLFDVGGASLVLFLVLGLVRGDHAAIGLPMRGIPGRCTVRGMSQVRGVVVATVRRP